MANMNNLKLSVCAGIAAAGMLLPASVFAGTEVTSKEVKPVQAPVQSAITGDFGVQFVSAYFTRGIMQQNQGAIVQPYADLYFALYQGDGFVNKVSLNLSIWSSIHSHHPGNLSTTKDWYEFDYTPGVAVTFAKNFTLTSSYFEYDSPAGYFSPERSLNFNLAFDDTDYLHAFALHPHFTYLRELSGVAGLGKHGNYYEVGITPGLAPITAPFIGPVTFTFPITVGLGSSGFYNNGIKGGGNGYGYTSAGIDASIPISFIPAAYGTWTFTAGATYYNLNGNVAAYDGNGAFDKHGTIKDGRHNDFVFNGGIGAAF